MKILSKKVNFSELFMIIDLQYYAQFCWMELIDKLENDGLYCKLGTNNYNTLDSFLSSVV